MSLETALYSRLSAYAGLNALVGARIYPMMLPQAPTFPAVTYFRVSTVPTQVFSAPASDQLRVRMQVSAWAMSYDGAHAVADQIVAALDGWYGLLGGAGGTVCAITLTNQVDLREPDTGRYQVPCDFEVWQPL